MQHPSTYELVYNNIRFLARIGVCEHERDGPQHIIIHLKLTSSWAGKDVVLDDIVDFKWVIDCVRDIVMEKHWDLVETLCVKIADVLMKDARLQIVDITLLKTDEIKEADQVGNRYVFTR